MPKRGKSKSKNTHQHRTQNRTESKRASASKPNPNATSGVGGGGGGGAGEEVKGRFICRDQIDKREQREGHDYGGEAIPSRGSREIQKTKKRGGKPLLWAGCQGK